MVILSKEILLTVVVAERRAGLQGDCHITIASAKIPSGTTAHGVENCGTGERNIWVKCFNLVEEECFPARFGAQGFWCMVSITSGCAGHDYDFFPFPPCAAIQARTALRE